ncbi:hypothetical protein PR048_013484 [Dryococelus australis]|uniref:Uncharacterized protein n=1 Tax=Dryococelus australis TaxID=614101 RepID=A0ABQ9HSA7_9NEOP|nr:hypothetical protein PR048_013484 [Dryococelus australis]
MKIPEEPVLPLDGPRIIEAECLPEMFETLPTSTPNRNTKTKLKARKKRNMGQFSQPRSSTQEETKKGSEDIIPGGMLATIYCIIERNSNILLTELHLNLFNNLQGPYQPFSVYVSSIKEATSVLRLSLTELEMMDNILEGLAPQECTRLVFMLKPD